MPQIDSWQAAEANAAEWMRTHGYPDATLTGGSSDQGIDVSASGALAQVKWEASQVGRPSCSAWSGPEPTRMPHCCSSPAPGTRPLPFTTPPRWTSRCLSTTWPVS